MTAPGPARSYRLPRLQFASFPSRFPANGVLASSLIHALAIIVIAWIHVLFPNNIRLLEVSRNTTPIFLDEKPVDLGPLPRVTSGGAGSGSRGGRAAQGHGSKGSAAAAAPSKAGPKAIYAGPQEIVSDLKEATNHVQTVKRPDMLAPPKLKFPLRLQSQVLIPATPPPILQAPPPPQNTLTQPQPAVTAVAKAAPILPVTVPQPRAVSPLAEPPKIQLTPTKPATLADMMNRQTPLLSAENSNARKAAIVVNAIEVPPDPNTEIPDAEIAGSFAVVPSLRPSPPQETAGGGSTRAGTGTSDGVSGTAHGTGTNPQGGKNANGSGPATGTGTGSQGNPQGGGGQGNSTGNGPGVGNGTTAGNGNGPGAGGGNRPGSGSGNGTGNGTGLGGGGGITINGGTGSTRAGHGVAPRSPQRGYEMTIISGGSNGGPSRDLGIFTRNETVYTVYISMADAGGGPDWSMQYSLIGTSAGNGLLSPPFAQSKVRANLPAGSTESSEQVFVTGVVDVKGAMQNLRAIRVADAKAQAAVEALKQWHFTPGEVNGSAVNTKVLIGVTLLPAVPVAASH